MITRLSRPPEARNFASGENRRQSTRSVCFLMPAATFASRPVLPAERPAEHVVADRGRQDHRRLVVGLGSERVPR